MGNDSSFMSLSWILLFRDEETLQLEHTQAFIEYS